MAMVASDQQSLAAGNNSKALKAHLEWWLDAKEVEGASIGIGYPDGSIAIVMSGDKSDGSEFEARDTFLATSVTKTMTAAIILDLATRQRLGLDQPAPAISRLPGFPYDGAFTVRQLLQHTSGLVSYQQGPAWSQKEPIDPLDALMLAGTANLEWAPGTEKGYSNSGYIYLGLIAEEVTGRTYAELFDEVVVGPLGLADTSLDDVVRPGWVGYSSGGLVSSIPDLVRWGAALYRDGLILEPAALAQMLDVNNEYNSGLGANPICPCGTNDDGSRWYTSIGHDGGSATVQYSPADGIVIAAKFSESFWTEDLSQREMHALLADIRTIAAVPAPVGDEES